MFHRNHLLSLITSLILFTCCNDAVAENGCKNCPTVSKQISFAPYWHGSLVVYAEKWTIDHNEGVDLWCVCEGGLPCPKYTWTVSGKGFHFGSTSGPNQGETQKDYEIITLYADNTACGTATITIKDSCDLIKVSELRCTSGTWQDTGDWLCYVALGGSPYAGLPIGGMRYVFYTNGAGALCSTTPGDPGYCCDYMDRLNQYDYNYYSPQNKWPNCGKWNICKMRNDLSNSYWNIRRFGTQRWTCP